MDQVEDLQELAHERDGVARRREERESPFTEEISLVEIPRDMKIPRKDMCDYNGIGDPDDHLDAYLDWMNMQGASNTLKCKIFPLTLVGDARTWIRESIRSSPSLDVGIVGSSQPQPSNWALLTFFPEDVEGVRYPHCDALVVKVKIANRTVKRVLIDHRSSTDIIH
ncbi:hypothetical protein ACOSQ3_005460 [Xanthoceras sorbifolium]